MDKLLLETLFGSHMYGTNTPTSDLDIKSVVLPSLDHLLLAKRVENKVSKTNTKANTRNSADDVDREFIPLQVFARDFIEGQTYAIELAFAADKHHAMQRAAPQFVEFVVQLRTKFLTSNVKAMMGYVFNQANIYSFKGERLNCARDFHELIVAADLYYKSDDTKLEILVTAPAWVKHVNDLVLKYPKYFAVGEYDSNGQGLMKGCFKLLEKILPFNITLVHAMQVVAGLIKSYGDRANSASESNVDWKAMMHAVRIVNEGLELLEHQTVTLPRPDDEVKYLLSIKRGEVPLEQVKNELVAKLESLKALALGSKLPNSNDPGFREDFEAFMLKHLKKLYLL